MKNFYNRLLTSILLILVLFFSLQNNIILSILLTSIVFVLFIEFNNLSKKIFKKKIFNLFFLIFFLFYLIYFSLSIWIFLNEDEIHNKQKLLFLLCICISTDLGGYTFGKLFKGIKLTKISPNKTYSGLIGSFLLSICVAIFIFNNLDFQINILLLAFLISLFSQIGDLFISFLKRKANIKDTGTFLPGHGGLLDRLDGIILAVPIGIILVSL